MVVTSFCGIAKKRTPAQVSGRLGLKAAAQHEVRLIYGVLEAVSVFGGESSRPTHNCASAAPGVLAEHQ